MTALTIMKTEEEYKEFLHDMGCDPFFIHYHGGEQVHLYRNYCHNVSYPKIIIDATGGVVRNFKKLGAEKTKNIFLYEALVHDSQKHHSFTITNMLSERHNNVAIFNWLAKWRSNDVPNPKECVCDQSLALLSAIVQCFTQYSSLNEYIHVCADLILGELPTDSRWLPRCFVRTDVAHFIKLACSWTPLKTVPKRVKEIILRTIGLLVKCQSINDMHSLLLSLFIVLINETDGNDKESGIETVCEKHKKHLICATSTGLLEFEDQFNHIIVMAETEDEAQELLQNEIDCQLEGLSDITNPFQSWAEEIYIKSKSSLQEGTGLNAMYLPTLIPKILKCIKLIPLWSGIMIPKFNYGEDTASSAAVESNFRKLKNLTFKNILLPTNIENFIEQHITSLKGATLIRSSNYAPILNSNSEKINTEEDNMENLMDTTDLMRSKNSSIRNVDCPLCKSGNLPLETGAHKCVICLVPIHALPSCSTHKEGHENVRICFKCSEEDVEVPTNVIEEHTSVESWNRKSSNQQKCNSYMCPNPNLRYVQIKSGNNIQTLPLLKNGSRSKELKCSKIKNTGRVIISNTCAFDTLASIFMTAYCDSENYQQQIDELKIENIFFQFISNIVKNGIMASTYSDRVKIILKILNPELQQMQYNTTLAICASTAGAVIKALLVENPTLIETISCTNINCKINESQSSVYITYQTSNDSLDDLQEFLYNRLTEEDRICKLKNCTGKKTITPVLSPIHMIIEILYWNSKCINNLYIIF